MAFICAICLTLLVMFIDAFIVIALFMALAKLIDYLQSR